MRQKIQIDRKQDEKDVEDKLDRWEDLKSRLDPDRQSMFKQILKEVRKYKKFIDRFQEEDKAEAALLSMLIETRRDLEDVRNQLELEKTRKNARSLPGSPEQTPAF